MLRRMVLLTGTLSLLSCQQQATVPKFDPGPVALTVFVTDTTLRAGDPDTIRVVVANSLEGIVRLDFDTMCTITVTIRNQANQVVLTQEPDECIRVPTSLTIGALGSITQTFVWTGGLEFAPPDTPAKLPAGAYFISATIAALNYSTFSPSVRVDLSSRN